MAAKSRIILIVVGIIVLIVVIVVFILIKNGGVYGVAGSGTNHGTGGQSISVASAYPDAPTGQYLSLGTSSGTVQMNNFYAASATQVGDDGVLILKQTADYWITYDPSDSSFWIAISGAPFASIRPTAEQDFLATLGVNATAACKLDVSVGAPYSATSSMNGQVFPLSFCQ